MCNCRKLVENTHRLPVDMALGHPVAGERVDLASLDSDLAMGRLDAAVLPDVDTAQRLERTDVTLTA
jgi:hypothetical protein